MEKRKWYTGIKKIPLQGSSLQSLGIETSLFGAESEIDIQKIDELMAAVYGSPENRNQLGATIYAPILQMVPYVELYSRFFQQVSVGPYEPVLFAVDADSTDVNLPAIVYKTSGDSEVFFNSPGFKFVEPTFQMFDYGITINWQVAQFAGWNVLERQMTYCAWNLARKRDAAAKTVIDAAIPVSHIVNHTGTLAKAPVDNIIRSSNQIGFPVKFAIINPGRLMEMQSWSWVMPTISFKVADELVNNLYYGRYGGVDWYASPNAPADTVYFGGSPEQTGWHVTKGAGRSDSAVDITTGEDKYTVRDPWHSWYVGNSGLNIWQLNVI